MKRRIVSVVILIAFIMSSVIWSLAGSGSSGSGGRGGGPPATSGVGI